jgi:hypothetical protein
MTAPVLTAWTFEYAHLDSRRKHPEPPPPTRITVEVPTGLGQEHAERVARCHLMKIPVWRDSKLGLFAPKLIAKQSAAKYRQEREAGISNALREFHKTRPKRGPSDPIPRSPNEPNYRS